MQPVHSQLLIGALCCALLCASVTAHATEADSPVEDESVAEDVQPTTEEDVAANDPVTVIPVTDPNWFFSPLNWRKTTLDDVVCMQSANPGAYFKFAFTGTTAAALRLNLTGNGDGWTVDLLFAVDDSSQFETHFDSSSTPASFDLTRGTALNESAIHTVYGVIRAQSGSRWQSPQVLRICGLALDAASDAHMTAYPAGLLRSTLVMTFGDSIGEGNDARAGTADSTLTWTSAVATALGAEWCNVAWSGQGYTSYGGDVPCFHWPGNATETTWDKYDAQHSRLVNGLLVPEPDYIFNGHGTNDFLHSQFPQPTVTACATSWLAAVRKAAPHAHVFLTVPFGGFMRDDLLAAYSAYHQQAPTDTLTHFIDLGPLAARGVNQPWTAAYESWDGIHPLGWRSEQLGGMLAVEAVRAIHASEHVSARAPGHVSRHHSNSRRP